MQPERELADSHQRPHQRHPPVCRYGAHPSSQDWASVSVRVPSQAGAQAESMQALLRQLPEQVFPAAGSWGVHQASRIVAAVSLYHPLVLHAQQFSSLGECQHHVLATNSVNRGCCAAASPQPDKQPAHIN